MKLRAVVFGALAGMAMTSTGCSGSSSGDDADPPPQQAPTDPPAGSAPALSVDDVTVAESSESVNFIVRAEGEASDQVWVDYTTADGSAVAGTDYVESAGTLTFPADGGEQTVQVGILADAGVEGEESFTLELSNPLNGEIEDSRGVATITDEGAATVCGAPEDDAAGPGIFLWKDCSAGVWHLRVTGSAGATEFAGGIDSARAFASVTPVDVEADDVVEQPSETRLSFVLEATSDTDRVEFATGQDAGSCFELSRPAGTPILVGPDRTAIDAPFDLATVEGCESSPPQTATGLNVVVVFTDDQRFDTLEHMPTVAGRLLPYGVEFTNAYVPTPLCCPARASTYSGGFLAQNTGVLWNFPPNGGTRAFDDQVNIGTRLQDAGYRTAFFGKWQNDYVDAAPYVPPGWSTFLGRSVYANVADWSTFRYVLGSSDASSSVGTETDSAGQYHVYFERDRIIEFIEGAPAEQPLFLFWATTPPHPPMTPDAPDQDAFADFTYRERGYGETDLSDKPSWVQDPSDEVPDGDDEEVRDQLRSMLSVDRSLDAIMDTLSAQGRLENTVFIFTSDNGYMWGEHGLWAKNKPYEESIRVPMLVVMPGVEPRSDDNLVAATLDLGPTLYDIAGIDAPSDGMSLVPLLKDPDLAWRDELFFEKYSPTRSVNGLWAGVRQHDWKYIEYWNGEAELYDLAADPFELENLADDPAYATIRERLAERTRAQLGLSIKPIFKENPDGRVGEPYELLLETWGGEPPLSWTVETGSLPPGLSLDAASGAITGTPGSTGSWTFRVRVTDSALARQTGEPRRYISDEITIDVRS